jgi:hypothetical protein
MAMMLAICCLALFATVLRRLFGGLLELCVDKSDGLLAGH